MVNEVNPLTTYAKRGKPTKSALAFLTAMLLFSCTLTKNTNNIINIKNDIEMKKTIKKLPRKWLKGNYQMTKEDKISMTQPGQAMTIKEVVQRYSNGQEIWIDKLQQYLDGEIPRPEILDMVDVQELNEYVNSIYADYNTEIEAISAKHESAIKQTEIEKPTETPKQD